MDDKTRVRCKDCGSEFDEEYIEYYLETDDPESDYIGHCPVCWEKDIAAISIIDPERISAEALAEARREAADRSELFVRNLLKHFTLPEDLYQDLRAAIRADESKEREADGPQIGDVVACRSQDNAGYLAHRWPGGLAPECYVVLMRRDEVERKLKEAKE